MERTQSQLSTLPSSARHSWEKKLGKLHRVIASPACAYEGLVDGTRWIELDPVGAQTVVPIQSNGSESDGGNLWYEVVSPSNERCWIHTYNLQPHDGP